MNITAEPRLVTPDKLTLPHPGSRTIVVGKTGSGKSVNATTLVGRTIDEGSYTMHLTIDPKHGVSPSSKTRPTVIIDDFAKINDHRECNTFIYRPRPFTSWETQKVIYNQIFRYCFEMRNVLIHINEAKMLGRDIWHYPEDVETLYGQGRSRNITIIAEMQRPRGCPSCMYSECEYFYCHELLKPEDRKVMSAAMGDEVKHRIMEKYAHWYYNHETGQLEYRKLVI